jgi:hypothetical protein
MDENQSSKLPVVLICLAALIPDSAHSEPLGIGAAGYITEGYPAIHDFDGHRSLL